MATTTVAIQDELGLRVPSVPSVPAISGESVAFSADKDAETVLYFSPQTAAILTPTPGSSVRLAGGESITYTFTGVAAESYGVIMQAPDVSGPTDFDFGPQTEQPSLAINAGGGLSFPGPTEPIKTGR